MQVVSLGAPPGSSESLSGRLAARECDSSALAAVGQRLVSCWRSIIASNTTLFLMLLAVNAWALPYAGLVHDARLYGIQVVNRVEDGAFGGDLYLQFGSQDRYTLFSSVAAPLVQAFELKPAFFLIYLSSSVVFLWGTQRLVLALCEDRLLASLALVFLATTHMTFAGLENFYINENFVTPRLASNGLVVWALALVLEQKTWNALALLVLALALHPLMACAGLLIIVVYLCSLRFSKWHAVALAVMFLAGGALLCFDSLAARLLGRMDLEWRDVVRRTSPYSFPAEWAVEDWWHILGAFGIALAACNGPLQRPTSRRLIACVASVAAAGVAINFISCQLTYALPIQGQGYRWLWPLQYLQIPLGVLLISSWWQQGALATRTAAVVLAAYLGSIAGDRSQFLALLPVLAAFGFYCAISSQNSRQRLGLVLSGLGVCWLLLHEFQALHAYWLKFSAGIDYVEFVRTAPTALLGFARWSLAILGVVGLVWFCKSRRAMGYALVATAILLQTGYFAAAYAAESTKPAPGIAMVRDYLREHGVSKNPTIYWPVGWVNHLWFDLHVDSYYEPMQIAGNAFSRENAMEGRRRGQLVKRFELERVRDLSQIYSPLQLQQLEALYQAKLSEPAPTWDDVAALCSDPKLDYLILQQPFTTRCVANDGVWFLYDCRAIRNGQPTPSENATRAARSKLP
jgi:hypothetical protein